MTFYLNQATNQFTRAVGVPAEVKSARVKARDTLQLDVYFHDGAVYAPLEAGALLVFVLKTDVTMAGVTLAMVNIWEEVEPGHYRAGLNLNTEPVKDLVGDLKQVSVLGELTWSNDGGASWESSNTLAVVIENDVYKGVEGTPAALPDPADWMPAPLELVAPLGAALTLGGEYYTGLLSESNDGVYYGTVTSQYPGGPGSVPGRVVRTSSTSFRLDVLGKVTAGVWTAEGGGSGGTEPWLADWGPTTVTLTTGNTTAEQIGQLAHLPGTGGAPDRWWIAEGLTSWREVFIGGELDAASIATALGFTPADAADIPTTPAEVGAAAIDGSNITDPAAFRGAIGARNSAISDRGVGGIYCDIPTHDGNPSLTHPSVLFFPKGWNGFPYWMAHTPYPAGERELPNIVASYDGQNWITPAGLTNPIATVSAGYFYPADAEIVMLADGLTMACFFIQVRSGDMSDTFRTISTDGVTWSTPSLVITGADLDPSGGSPSIVLESDGSLSMFAIAPTAADVNRPNLIKRTSADNGVTWSAATVCSIPTAQDIYLWHLSVRKVDGVYHMLFMNNLYFGRYTGRQFYLTSADGISWQGDVSRPAIPRLGDFDHHTYRSSFLPVPGEKDKWDVWLAVMPAGYGTSTASGLTHPWQVRYLRGIELKPSEKLMREYDVLHLLDNTVDFPMGAGIWNTAVTGTGNIEASSKQALFLRTGTTTGSSIVARPFATTAILLPWSDLIVPQFRNTWKNRVRATILISTTVFDANGILQFLMGGGTAGAMPYPLNHAGVGFNVVNNRLQLIMHDGTDLVTQDIAGWFPGSSALRRIVVEANGDGTASINYNGTQYGPFDGAPHNQNVDYYNSPGISISNGAGVANLQAIVGKLVMSKLNPNF